MTILFTILLLTVGSIALLLILALFMKRELLMNREVIINVPAQQVFYFLKLLKNQDKFSNWAIAGKENREERFSGIDGTIGFVYGWSINNGTVVSEKEITNIIEGKRIETEVRFIKPIRTISTVIYEITTLSEKQTRVNQINIEKVKYPLNLLIAIAAKRNPKKIDENLLALKNVIEKKMQVL
jgi:hypothetical protein